MTLHTSKVKYKHLVIGENTIPIPKERTIEIEDAEQSLHIRDNIHTTIRTVGELKNRAILLPSQYEWVLGKDSYDSVCLVPLRPLQKEEE